METDGDIEQILYYNVHSEPFSNFYPSPFTIDEKAYPTAEHFYQSKKFEGTPREEEIRLAKTIHSAHQLGHTAVVGKDWDERREKVYFDAVFNKFSKNEDLRLKLLATRNKDLICIDTDSFWGKQFNEEENKLVGENKAGKILMKVREILEKQE